MLRRKARETIKKYGLLQTKDDVIVGVSGGADSMALLHFLWEESKTERYRLTAAHINHMLRKGEADRDEEHVRAFCLQKSIPFKSFKTDVRALSKKSGKSFEECGREVRYDFFEKLMKGQEKIVTAHTLSDRIETMLFHMARGTSLQGFSSIPVKRGNIVRPLIECLREEVEDYCREYEIAYVTDSTNTDTRYARNKIRSVIIPAFKEINSCFMENSRNLLEDIRDNENFMNKIAEKEYYKYNDGEKLQINAYLELPTAIWRRVLVKFLHAQKITVSKKLILLIEKMINGKSTKLSIESQHCLVLENDYLANLEMKSENFPVCFEQDALIGENAVDDEIWSIQIFSKEHDKNTQKIYKNLSIGIWDYDKIVGKLKIRTRLPGDKIKLTNRPTKTIKKLFNEKKIPLWERDRKILLADDEGVVFAQELGIDQRVAISEATQTYAVIFRGN